MRQEAKRLLAAALTAGLSSAAFAAEPGLLGFDLGISTGIPIYSADIESSIKSMNGGSASRIVIGGITDATLRLGAPLKLMAGADLLCDFAWDGGDYSNSLDYAFFGGVKVYPSEQISGLALSIAYALGCRSDFTGSKVSSSADSTAFGNGFRLSAEYRFLHNFPAVGIYYRMMPRGKRQYDNIFAVYLAFSL